MTEVSSIAEQLLFTTVRIETVTHEAEKRVGTGFLFSYKIEDKEYLFLVTCKHIINNTKDGYLTFIKARGQKPILEESYRLKIDNFENGWVKHTSDKIDVAILPFVPILQHISNQGTQIFFKAIPHTLVPSDEKLRELDAIEDVLFIGYPAGLYDQKNLIPIIRRGITATPVYLDFNGEKQFLIDASVFPGSSGSPVFIYEPAGYFDKKAKALVMGGRIFFLGVLSAVFRMPDTGKIIIPTGKTPFVKISQLVDIGVVFKAEIIIETIQEFLEEIKDVRPSPNSG